MLFSSIEMDGVSEVAQVLRVQNTSHAGHSNSAPPLITARSSHRAQLFPQRPRPGRRPSARGPLNIQAFMALGEMHQLRRHGGSGDKPAGSLLQPEFLLPKSLNPRLGRRVFYASRQCFVPRAGTTQNSGGTKPFSAPAKTSGNRRWIPIDHQMKGRKGP